MKIIGLFLFIITLILCPEGKIYSQGYFEGKITIDVPGVEDSGQLSYYKKGDKIRMNVEGKQRNSDLIIDPDNNEMIILMTQMNKYVVFPFKNSDFRKNEGGGNFQKESESLKDFKKTGIEKTISGYKCEKWVYNYSDREIEAWLTKGLGSFRFFNNPIKNEILPTWKTEIENSGYFPMKIDERINSGGSMNLLEVKSVKMMKVEDNYFQPPEDFEKMKRPNMDSMKSFMQKNH